MLNCHYYDDPRYIKLKVENTGTGQELVGSPSLNIGSQLDDWLSNHFWWVVGLVVLILVGVYFIVHTPKKRRR